jgi:streptogramin lyase
VRTASDLSAAPGWAKGGLGKRVSDLSDIAVSDDDRVYVLLRNKPCVLVFDEDGSRQGSWGDTLLSPRPHGIAASRDGAVWIADQSAHSIKKFSPDGNLLLTLGDGYPSNSGYDAGTEGAITRTEAIVGGPPFNNPTAVVVSDDGEVFVADGYGNCRIHHFSASGDLQDSFGSPGSGVGEFRTPHAITLDPDGYLLLADRGNERLYRFNRDGRLITSWDVQRPNSVAIGPDGNIYIGHSACLPGGYSWRRGAFTKHEPACVTVRTNDGKVVETLGPEASSPVSMANAHGVAVSARGDVYVVDVTSDQTGNYDPAPALQKFVRAPA